MYVSAILNELEMVIIEIEYAIADVRQERKRSLDNGPTSNKYIDSAITKLIEASRLVEEATSAFTLHSGTDR